MSDTIRIYRYYCITGVIYSIEEIEYCPFSVHDVPKKLLLKNKHKYNNVNDLIKNTIQEMEYQKDLDLMKL